MGAGEQSIHVSYKGRRQLPSQRECRGALSPSTRPKVSVRSNSTNIFAGDELPEELHHHQAPLTRFDLYTIYAGVTSNVTTGLYLDLPERATPTTLCSSRPSTRRWRPSVENSDTDDAGGVSPWASCGSC